MLLYVQEVLVLFLLCPRILGPFYYMSKKSWPILLYVQEVLTYFTICPRNIYISCSKHLLDRQYIGSNCYYIEGDKTSWAIQYDIQWLYLYIWYYFFKAFLSGVRGGGGITNRIRIIPFRIKRIWPNFKNRIQSYFEKHSPIRRRKQIRIRPLRRKRNWTRIIFASVRPKLRTNIFSVWKQSWYDKFNLI